MTGPLTGIRMIDLGYFHSGVACGYMLGDLGAEVIKVEERERGDAYRGYTSSLRKHSLVVDGVHVLFDLANRNKKSITLDLKKEKGKQILRSLVEKSDVFYTNFRKTVLARLGADYATLRQFNPRLIYGHASGYGKGPESERRIYDPTAMARSGMMWSMGKREDPEPVHQVAGMCDQSGAIMMAHGLMAALICRERTGKGQEVEISLFGSAVHLQALGMSLALRGQPLARHSHTETGNPFNNTYRCADDKWILLGENQAYRFWSEFCHVLGAEWMKDDPRFGVDDPRFGTNLEAIKTHSSELIVALDRIFSTKSRDEWIARFREICPDFACDPVNAYDDLMNDPQVVQNEILTEFDHPVLGSIKVVGFPAQFSETPAAIQRAAPELGQHTEEVLHEVLDFSWDQIGQLKEDEVI